MLVGAGSTAPAALYSRWTQEYNKRNRNIQVRYLPSSTGEGITLVTRDVSDFGAGETRLTDKERKEGSITELPVAVLGIVPIYNLPDVQQGLRLSGEVLAEIYLGEVKSWSAPQLAKLNPEITLPNLPIQVINRPAGRGSNYIFTEFLSKANSRFRTQVGVSTSPKWPVGGRAERSSDMVDKVKNTVGSIGYVEYQYAVRAGIPRVAVLNGAGKFAPPSPQSIGAACNAVEALQRNGYSSSLSSAPGIDSYPITGFTWIYLRIKPTDEVRMTALNDFVNWIYADGQQIATEEGYPPLPSPLLANLRRTLKISIRVDPQQAVNRSR
ncbi:MAG: phosphate ABC transporter substrate-binding protein PstS [Candidatus Sulfotelmatobacter sp.]